MRALCLAAVILAGLQSFTAVPGNARTQIDLDAYRAAVDEYRDGRAPADGNTPPPIADASILDRVATGANGWTADDLAGAAMMHTDAALRLVKAARPSDAAIHLDAALAALQAAASREPQRLEFARRWRDTVASLLQAFNGADLASSVRTRAMTWTRETQDQAVARAAFEAGVTSEIQAAVAGPLSGGPPKRALVVPPQALWELKEAAKQFELALTRDPSCFEAALHLGRARLLDKRDADAERWLRVAARAPGRAVRYLAVMLLGVLAEQQARYADAERRYREAMEAFRWGQSAPLALSHVLMRAGRDLEARETVAAHLQATRGRVVEPLRTYLAIPDTDPAATFDQLRAEVWR